MAKKLFKPGEPRHPEAGRKKGTPNKKTKEFMVMLEERNYDLGETYLDLYEKQMQLFDELRKARPGAIMSAAELLVKAGVSLNNMAQFVYPKKKAIEHSGSVGVTSFAEFMASVAERRKNQQK